jgi:hypothetical protein
MAGIRTHQAARLHIPRHDGPGSYHRPGTDPPAGRMMAPGELALLDDRRLRHAC